MVMELIVAALMIVILVPVVRHIARTPYSRGWFMNMFEAMLLFIRDDVARPAIGGHGADRFLPYLWTAFFFVLFNNLLGMIPGWRLGHRQCQRDGGPRAHDARRRGRRRHARDGASSATGWGSCRTWTFPGCSSRRSGA